MKYIINGTVQFLVAERKLTGNGGVEVILSNPACRLLIVFLEHNHQQVSREILLEKVWEDFGLVSSESSLNNSISSLRRGLRDVGIDNTIETVPKKGFEFHVDDLLLENITADFLINNMESEAVVGSGVKTKPKSLLKNHRQIIFSALFVLFILFSVLLFYKEKNQEYKFFGHVGKCNIYFFNGIKGNVKKYFSSARGKELLSQCNQPAVVYYDETSRGKKGGIPESIASICSIGVDGKINACKNYVDIIHN